MYIGSILFHFSNEKPDTTTPSNWLGALNMFQVVINLDGWWAAKQTKPTDILLLVKYINLQMFKLISSVNAELSCPKRPAYLLSQFFSHWLKEWKKYSRHNKPTDILHKSTTAVRLTLS